VQLREIIHQHCMDLKINIYSSIDFLWHFKQIITGQITQNWLSMVVMVQQMAKVMV
jgi:hypothetical protein